MELHQTLRNEAITCARYEHNYSSLNAFHHDRFPVTRDQLKQQGVQRGTSGLEGYDYAYRIQSVYVVSHIAPEAQNIRHQGSTKGDGCIHHHRLLQMSYCVTKSAFFLWNLEPRLQSRRRSPPIQLYSKRLARRRRERISPTKKKKRVRIS
jgi:hypothetical protein